MNSFFFVDFKKQKAIKTSLSTNNDENSEVHPHAKKLEV